jgi:predicted RNA-binding Zn ribbon-like protein
VTAFPDRIGGRLCLDFVNTVDRRLAVAGRDHLPDYETVLEWCASTHTRLPRGVDWLRQRASARVDEAAAAHRRVVDMRQALDSVLRASISGGPVRPGDLAEVNDALGRGIGHRVLLPDDRGGVREGWRSSDALDQVLWPVAIDAWDLLTEPELRHVRSCPVESGGCGWLFLDTSRSGNRRWCDMRTCGNRAKVRAHHTRRTG